MLQWFRRNKEWMFCGISIPILVALTNRFRTKTREHTRQPRNNPGNFHKVGISQSLAVRNGNVEPSETSIEPLDHLQTGRDPATSVGFSYTDMNSLGSERREMIMRQIWHRAEEMLQETEIQAAALRMKTVVPVLQYASLEEDRYLQDRWAALLANAATQSGPSHVAFPEVLRQLTVQEVRFSEALYTLAEQRTIELRNIPPQDRAAESVRSLGTPSDLHKLYCAAVHTESTSNSMYEFSIALDNLRRCQIIQGPGIDHPQISFTAFGVEFISACRPPEPDTSPNER
jgi:Abortive infection alpha